MEEELFLAAAAAHPDVEFAHRLIRVKSVKRDLRGGCGRRRKLEKDAHLRSSKNRRSSEPWAQQPMA